MKKVIFLLIALSFFVLPATAYADTEVLTFEEKISYDVFIDGKEQSFDAIYGDWSLYIPIVKTYEALGAIFSTSADGQLTIIELDDKKIELNKSNDLLQVYGGGKTISADLVVIDGDYYISFYNFKSKLNHIAIEVYKDKQLHLLTLKGTESKLDARNERFKVESPDLYAAFEKFTNKSYEFDYNLETNINIKPLTEEAAGMLPISKVLLSLDADGYMNIPKDNLDVKMNVVLDAGPILQQSIEGMRVMLIKNILYRYDPQYDEWDKEEVLELSRYKEGKDLFAQGNYASAWLLVDNISKSSSTNGITTYKATLKEAEIREAVDSITFEGYYDILLGILEEERTFVTIDKIESIYDIKEGQISKHYTEASVILSLEGVEMTIKLSSEGTFGNYGLEKNLVIPKPFRPSLQPR